MSAKGLVERSWKVSTFSQRENSKVGDVQGGGGIKGRDPQGQPEGEKTQRRGLEGGDREGVGDGQFGGTNPWRKYPSLSPSSFPAPLLQRTGQVYLLFTLSIDIHRMSGFPEALAHALCAVRVTVIVVIVDKSEHKVWVSELALDKMGSLVKAWWA